MLLLETAIHIKMARAQRALYQGKVARAVQDATAKKDHSLSIMDRIWSCPAITVSSPAACITSAC